MLYEIGQPVGNGAGIVGLRIGGAVFNGVPVDERYAVCPRCAYHVAVGGGHAGLRVAVDVVHRQVVRRGRGAFRRGVL